jgi:hypothetical protein
VPLGAPRRLIRFVASLPDCVVCSRTMRWRITAVFCLVLIGLSGSGWGQSSQSNQRPSPIRTAAAQAESQGAAQTVTQDANKAPATHYGWWEPPREDLHPHSRSRPGAPRTRRASSRTRLHSSHGLGHRSTAAKDAFKREQPCPSTGKPAGACPGYVIDHATPLACGGADDPSNMQWQTTAEAKAKDQRERKGCR